MTVKELIEQLERNYTPETDLYVEYWDKEIAQSFARPDLAPMTDEQWGEVVENLEEKERYDQSLVADAIAETVEDVVAGESEPVLGWPEK